MSNVRHLTLLATFVQTLLLTKIFSFKRDPDGKWIIVLYDGFLKYAHVLVIAIIYGLAYYDHFSLLISGSLLCDHLYSKMTFTLLLINGIANTINTIRNNELIFSWYKSLEAIDKLNCKYNIEIDYLLIIIISFVYIILAPVWILEFTLTRMTSWQHCLHLLLHATIFHTALAQALIPTLYFASALLNGYILFRKMDETIRGLKVNRFNIIETLNDMMAINFSYIDIIVTANRIARFSLVTTLLQTFSATLFTMVCLYLLGICNQREELFLTFLLNVTYCVIIAFVFLVDLQQKQLGNSVIEIDNPTKDERIEILRRQFLLQLLHHKFDMTAYGMITLYPSLLLVGMGSLSTMSMFVFQLYPELLVGN